jgi:lysophospholipase L1-like esterase
VVSVALLGDSQLTDTARRPVTKLGPRLRRRGYDVATLAVDGLDTRQALRNTEPVRPTDWAVYCFGANDAAPWKQVPPDEFVANYEAILRRTPARRSLVLGPAPVAETDVPGTRRNQATAQYSELARLVADRCGAVFIALLDVLGPENLAADGVHLNDHAYAVVEQLVIETIKRNPAESENDAT